MNGFRIKGKISLIWLLALAALLYTGVRLVAEANERNERSAEVFANGGVYENANISLKDLLG